MVKYTRHDRMIYAENPKESDRHELTREPPRAPSYRSVDLRFSISMFSYRLLPLAPPFGLRSLSLSLSSARSVSPKP